MGDIADDHYADILANGRQFDMDEDDDRAPMYTHRGPLRCCRCGSTDVRWRRQTGRWVLFSLQAGVEHVCSTPASADEFEVLT